MDGNKVRASANDGANGTDGITPKFKIEDGNWYISYDSEKTWELLGRAIGKDGLAGEDRDSLFKKVYIEDGYVCFELNDESNTIIRIPLMKEGTLTVTLDKEGTLSKVLSSEQARTTTSLILKGKANFDDMRTIQVMTSLQTVDLSGVDFITQENGYGGFKLNPYKDTLINRGISEVILPKFTDFTPADFSYCLAMKKVTVTCDYTPLYSDADSYSSAGSGHNYYITLCPHWNELDYAEGVTKINQSNGWYKYRQFSKITYPSTMKYIPASLTCFTDETKESRTSGSLRISYYYHTVPCDVLICKAIVPPVLDQSTFANTMYYDSENKWYYGTTSGSSVSYRSYYKVNVPSNAVLYVPSESIEAYRTAPIWENYTNILPLESL